MGAKPRMDSIRFRFEFFVFVFVIVEPQSSFGYFIWGGSMGSLNAPRPAQLAFTFNRFTTCFDSLEKNLRNPFD